MKVDFVNFYMINYSDYDMKLFFMSFYYSAKALQVCGVLKERVNVTKIKIANFALAVNTGS